MPLWRKRKKRGSPFPWEPLVYARDTPPKQKVRVFGATAGLALIGLWAAIVALVWAAKNDASGLVMIALSFAITVLPIVLLLAEPTEKYE
jgi:hypothetical protein